MGAKAKETSLPHGFIKNPFYCSHWAATKIKENYSLSSSLSLGGIAPRWELFCNRTHCKRNQCTKPCSKPRYTKNIGQCSLCYLSSSAVVLVPRSFLWRLPSQVDSDRSPEGSLSPLSSPAPSAYDRKPRAHCNVMSTMLTSQRWNGHFLFLFLQVKHLLALTETSYYFSLLKGLFTRNVF